MALIRFDVILVGWIICTRWFCQGNIEANEIECDFVIVGAGTTSLALGGLLAEIEHWKVCVLERGPMDTHMEGWYSNSYKFTSPHDPVWLTNPALRTMIKGRNSNKDGRNIYIPRFRGRGGTSRVYGAINRRASPGVLDLWPEGWKHADITHYYKKQEDHYCYYDSEDVTGISADDCKKWHGKGGAMQVNTQMEEAFQKFSREMKYICQDDAMPWKGYASDYNGPLKDRISCSVFQQFKLRTNSDYEPTPETRNNRASKTARGSSYTGYYQNRKNKPDLYTSTTVTKILFENGKAIGVLCLDSNGDRILTFRARKEVILGGGSFDTPHLLQVSGVGPEKLLRKINVDIVADNPHVGQNLWDHISVPYVLKLSSDSDDLCCSDSPDQPPTVNIDGTIYKTNTLNSINGPFSWILHLRSNLTRIPLDMSDIQIYVMGNSKLFDETGSLCTSSNTRNDLKEYNFCGDDDYTDSEDLNEGTIRIIDQWPEYRGSVKAVTSNIFDKPELDYGWTYTEDGTPTKEFKTVAKLFREQIRMLRDLFFGKDIHINLRDLIIDEVAPGKEIDTDEELDSWMRDMFVSALHPVGTCKMPECADEFLRVKGVSNLRVCDASAFATQTDGNPTATLFAMGEKLADMLKYQYLKFIKVVIRQDQIDPVKRITKLELELFQSEIQSETKCSDVSVTNEILSTGKNSFAVIYKWTLVCSEYSNENEVANIVFTKALNADSGLSCFKGSFVPFNTHQEPISLQNSVPSHSESSYVYLVWCQVFPSVQASDLWKKVGDWHGNDGAIPGSMNCFKLNCEEEMCSILMDYNEVKMELIYAEPNLSLPITNYLSTKKVVQGITGESTYFRSGSFRSNAGSDWENTADYLIEDVYAISGQRLSRQYPPMNSENGWWTERSDGLLYYETKGIHSNTKLAAFDLDGTLIETSSAETFPEDEYDWEFAFKKVPQKLQENVGKGINNVIMSNQNGIGLGYQNKKEWMRKIETIVTQLGVPMYVLAATGTNKYRKPEIGMWEYYTCTLNQFKTIDADAAVYVGDSAGRPNDFSDSDKKFAENVGIQFSIPEEYFLSSSEMDQIHHNEL